MGTKAAGRCPRRGHEDLGSVDSRSCAAVLWNEKGGELGEVSVGIGRTRREDRKENYKERQRREGKEKEREEKEEKKGTEG